MSTTERDQVMLLSKVAFTGICERIVGCSTSANGALDLFDSLMLFELWLELEAASGLTLPEDFMSDAETLGEVHDRLLALTGAALANQPVRSEHRAAALRQGD